MEAKQIELQESFCLIYLYIETLECVISNYNRFRIYKNTIAGNRFCI